MPAMIDASSAMQEDLSAEKKVMMKQWANREMQIERVNSVDGGVVSGLARDARRLRRLGPDVAGAGTACAAEC
jgi:hypothetical protein